MDPTIEDGWELVDEDPETGRKLWRYMDYDNQREVYKTTLPVGSILDANAAERSMTAGQRWGDMRKVASIPMNEFFDKYAEAVKNHDDTHVKKLLNDSDNRAFRTFEGNL